MATVQAVVQEGWREILARIFAQDVPEAFAEIVSFKLGEGGFIDVPPKDPITPDPTFKDVQGEGTPSTGGTVQFTNASAGVVGVGTTFLAEGISPGDWIKPGPTFVAAGLVPNSAGDVSSFLDDWGEVLVVVDDLNITLAAPYIGVTPVGARGLQKATEPLFTFRKALTPADVLFTSAAPAITEIISIALAGEHSTDQLGNNPEFFEVGLFDANNVMLVYMTFPLETWTPAIQLNHIVEIVF